jgi:hypothetical protein
VEDLLEIAAALLPGVRLDRAVPADHGNIHHVLLIPGVAAVRVSKRPSAAAAMPRRVTDRKTTTSAGQGFATPDLVIAVGVEGVWSGGLGVGGQRLRRSVLGGVVSGGGLWRGVRRSGSV